MQSQFVLQFILVASALLTPVDKALGTAIVESSDRLEVNWSSLKIRFYGEAVASSDDDAPGLKAAERRAWQDGLAYVSEAVRNLNATVYNDFLGDPDKVSSHAREAARAVAASTFSYNTTYFADGTIRVHLENSLSRALETAAVRFRQKEALTVAAMAHTGIVLRLDKAVRPRPIYMVVDAQGNVLFNVADMAEQAFRRNLMGRWFQAPTPSELAEAVGRNPLVVPATSAGEGRFVVDRESWDKAVEGHRAYLINGTIALALP